MSARYCAELAMGERTERCAIQCNGCAFDQEQDDLYAERERRERDEENFWMTQGPDHLEEGDK